MTRMVTKTPMRLFCCLSGLLSAGCSEPSPVSIEGVTVGNLGFAVIASDYTVSSISLLDSEGLMAAPDFVNSGSASTGLVTALSGDVFLPTRSGEPETLILIDRFRTDVLTRINIERGEVLGQVKTKSPNSPDDERAFSSNPYDYIFMDEHNAWITRFGVNTAADASAPNRGTDLFHIDPTSFERTGRRIDLAVLNASVQRLNPDTGESTPAIAHARPARMVRLGNGYVVVGLGRLTIAFDAVAPGMVALVNLDSGEVQGVELADLQDCSQVVPVPGAPDRVAVACVGFFRGNRRAGAGLAIFRRQGAELQLEHVWRAAADDGAALSVYGLVALGGARVVAVAAGDTDESTQDGLYELDLETGAQKLIFRADGQFVLGDGAFNAEASVLLIPDASVDESLIPIRGVQRFSVSDDAIEALGVVEVDDFLPARQVMPL